MTAATEDPTDPHRDTLYRCEHDALPDGGRRFRRFAELERFVTEVVLGPWWEQEFPDAPIEVTVLRRSARRDVLGGARGRGRRCGGDLDP